MIDETLPRPGITDKSDQDWDELHAQLRFRPRFPSEAVVRFIARAGRDPGRTTLLDMGCGAGRHLALIEQAGYRGVGMDYSLEGLRHAADVLQQAIAPSRLAQSRMQALPFRSDTFDGAISYGVLYYSDAEGYRAAVGELRRVLKAGAKLLVVTRTTRDFRHGRGNQVEPHTFVADDNATNERGMPIHFLTRGDVDEMFKSFRHYTVDWQDFSFGGGEVVNSDWVIEAIK